MGRRPGQAAKENAARKAAAVRAIREAKNRPCADCGQEYPHYVMDLDHRPEEPKLFCLGGQPNRSMRAILLEIAKCDAVCANCHRIRTHTREGAYGPRIRP